MVQPVARLLDFTGRTAIVTGAGGGIGATIAQRFSEAGASVVVNYQSNEIGARDVVERIEAAERRAIAVQADVTRRRDVKRLMERAVEEFGRIDILINNAGTYPRHSLLDMTDEDWELVLAANLRSAFLCTQLAARRMIEQEHGGVIVNISTIEAENPAPMHAHYNAAKGGLAMLTRSAAAELGSHGIRVNSVSPGLIWRESIEEQWPDGVDRWRRKAPLKRLGLPEDVADACLFLASPGASFITGSDLRVDGGVMTTQIF